MTGNLVERIVGSLRQAPLVEAPFRYLLLQNVFPDYLYAAMPSAMPSVARLPCHVGGSKSARRNDGTPTRVKIDQFPEFIHHLPAAQCEVWRQVGLALRSQELPEALVGKLAPAS